MIAESPLNTNRGSEISGEGGLLPLDRKALGEVAHWLVSTVTSTPDEAPGYRDLYWEREAGTYRWFHPWSNSAERIEALLWADQFLQTPGAKDAAYRYADRMCRDSARGICLDENHPAHGMVAYWNECGSWMTNYTMRVPVGFLLASEVFGEQRFADVARAAGEALLRFQIPNGMLPCGFSADAHPSVTLDSINSRVFYALDAFSCLHARLGERKWRDAHERLLEAALHHQRADGSFPEQVMLASSTGDSSSCKGHFHAYTLLGAARSLARDPANDRLHEMASNLAEFCARRIEEFGFHVFGDHLSESDSENRVWRSRTHEIAAGFACLGSVTENLKWTDLATKEVTHALQSRSDGTDCAFAAGAIPTYVLGPAGEEPPAYGGFYSVWILLAASVIEESISRGQPEGQPKSQDTQ